MEINIKQIIIESNTKAKAVSDCLGILFIGGLCFHQMYKVNVDFAVSITRR